MPDGDLAPVPRERSRRQVVVATVVALQLLLLAFPRTEGPVGRIVWPFSAGHMFNFKPQGSGPRADVIRHHQVVLLNGDEERPLKLAEVVHPNLFAFINTFKFRMRDGTWTERQTEGLSKAIGRYRCARGIQATGYAIYALDWNHADLLAGSRRPSSRQLHRSLPLPACAASRPPS